MANKFMYISNDDTQYYPFCRLQLSGWNVLETQLNESTNQNTIKVPKAIKTLLLDFGD